MNRLADYFSTLVHSLSTAQASDHFDNALSLEAAIDKLYAWARDTHERGYKLMIIGNGGSAGIASHSAIDYSKNGNLRTLAFNDGAALTCLGNDFGYEHVFAKQIEFHGRSGDMLIAISSSGQSKNILHAVETARKIGIRTVTLSGFKPDNPLRQAGDLNLYVASLEYGFVELSHQTLLHAALDLGTGMAAQAS